LGKMTYSLITCFFLFVVGVVVLQPHGGMGQQSPPPPLTPKQWSTFFDITVTSKDGSNHSRVGQLFYDYINKRERLSALQVPNAQQPNPLFIEYFLYGEGVKYTVDFFLQLDNL